MGNDLSRNDRPLCGVLVPAELTPWPDESTNLDEAGPLAGPPTESRATGMTLSSSGTPDNLDTLEIRSQFAGVPGFNGAGFCYRQTTSPAQDFRGWDSPSAVTYSEYPTWTTSSTSGRRHPSVSTLNNDYILVVADFPLQTGTGLRRVVRRRRSPTGTWGSWSIIHTEDANGTGTFGMLHPQALTMPNGDVELFHFHNDRINSKGNLMKQVSLDNGVTFEVAQERCLLLSIELATYEPERLRIAKGNGQHLAIVELRNISTGARTLRQYASRDNGATFDLIGDAISGENPDVVAVGGFFVVSYSVSNVVKSRRVGSAFSSLSETQEITATYNGNFTALAPTDNDELYLFAYDTGNDFGYLTRSTDYGNSFEATVTSQWLMRPFNFQSDGITFPTMSWWRGSLVIASNNGGATAPHSLSLYFLGGFSTVTLPSSDFSLVSSGQMGWQETFQAYATLDNVTTMTASLGLGATASVADGKQTLTGGAGASIYSVSASQDIAETLCRAAISTTTGRTSIFMRSGTASFGCEIEIRLQATSLAVYDAAAGTIIGSSAATTVSTTYDILAACKQESRDCAIWYRARGAATDERVWTLLASATSLTDDGGTGVKGDTGRAIHYEGTSLGSGYTIDLHELCWQFSNPGSGSLLVWDRCGEGLASGQTNPDDLFARNYTLKPTYAHDGISISASGVTRRGDVYTITPTHTYEIENTVNVPSPRVAWRSQTTTADMSIAFRLQSNGTKWANDIIGIYLDKINFKQFKVELRQGGSWVDYGTFNASYDVGFNRFGDCVLPQTAGSNVGDRRFFYQNELVEGSFQFPSNEVRPIVRNMPGIDDGGTPESKRTAYFLDPASITGLEPTGPAAGASVWYPRAFVDISLVGSRNVQGIRITVRPSGASPAPYSGYYTIGTIAIGPISVFGWAPDNTRSVARQMADEVITEADGTRSLTKNGQVDRRRAEISWARASRATEIQGNGSPNYVTSTTAAGAQPVATRFGTPVEFDGLLAEHGKKPLVYLPFLVRNATVSRIYTSHYCRGAIFGRVVNDTYRVETVAGTPEKSETIRTSVVTIEEEI